MKKLTIIASLLIFLSSCKKNIAVTEQVNSIGAASNSVALCPNTLTCTLNSSAMVQRDSVVNTTPLYTNTNYGNYAVFKAEKWFAPGHIFESRSLIKFNLPANFFTGFNFCQAYLQLKENADPNSITYYGVNYPYAVSQPNNKAYILRVAGNWMPNAVTWNSQPPATTANAAVVPSIPTGSSYVAGSDLQSINITAIMHNVQTAGTDYGLAIAMPLNTLQNSARQFGGASAPALLQAQLVFYY